MSAIDDRKIDLTPLEYAVKHYAIWGGEPHADRAEAARAELAALRDSLTHWSTLWDHICKRLAADAGTLPNEANFDAMIYALHAIIKEQQRDIENVTRREAVVVGNYQRTVAEQARQLAEAQEAIERCAAYIGSIDHGETTKSYMMCAAWLAANATAPQTEQEQTRLNAEGGS